MADDLAKYNALFEFDTNADEVSDEIKKLIDSMEKADIASGKYNASQIQSAKNERLAAARLLERKEAQDAVNKSVTETVNKNKVLNVSTVKMQEGIKKTTENLKKEAKELKESNKAKTKAEGGNKKLTKSSAALAGIMRGALSVGIGIATTALTVMGAAVASTQAGLNGMQRAVGAGSIALRTFGNRLATIGESSALFLALFSTGQFQLALNVLVDKFKGIGDEVKENVIANDALIKKTQELERQQAKHIVTQAQYEAQIKRLNTQAKDQNATFAQTEETRRKAFELQSILDAQAIKNAEKNLRIIKEINEIKRTDNQPNTTAELVKEAKAEEALIRLRTAANVRQITEAQRLAKINESVRVSIENINAEIEEFFKGDKTDELIKAATKKASEQIEALIGSPEQISAQAKLIRDRLRLEIISFKRARDQEFEKIKAISLVDNSLRDLLGFDLKDDTLLNDAQKAFRDLFSKVIDGGIKNEKEIADTINDKVIKAMRQTANKVARNEQDNLQDGDNLFLKLLGFGKQDEQDNLNSILESAVNATDLILSETIRRADSEIDIQRDKIRFLGSLQEEATDQQLRLEQTRLEQLQAKREKAVTQQRKLTAIQVSLSNAAAIASGIAAIAGSFNPAQGGGLFKGIATTLALGVSIVATIASLTNAFSSVPSFFKGRNPDEGINKVGRGDIDGRGGSLSVIHPNEMVVPEKITQHPAMKGIQYNDLPQMAAMAKIGRQAIAEERVVNIPGESGSRTVVYDKKIHESLEYQNRLMSRKKTNIIFDAKGVREIIGSASDAEKRVERAFY